MRNVSDKEREKLAAEIAGLESLDLNQLRARWKLLYEIEAPPHLSRDLLRRAVAYRIQENVVGGLKPATRRPARIFHSTRIVRTRAQSRRPGSEESSPSSKSMACITATNVSLPDSSAIFAYQLVGRLPLHLV